MKNTSKIITLSVLAVAVVTFASGAYAFEPNTLRNSIRSTVRQQVNEETRDIATATGQTIRNEIKEQVRQEVKDLKQNRQNIIDTIKDKIKKLLPRRIHGKLSAINGSVLTIATDKGDVTVYVTSATQLRRRFGALSSLSEFAVGDELAVIGPVHTTTDSSSSVSADNSAIDARYIRDISIQRRNTVFVGTIQTIGSNTFTVQTQSRGLQTVYVSDTTTYQLRNTKIAFADLKVGDRVLVKGEIWDRALSNINALRVIKLPAVPASGNESSSAAPVTTSGSSSAASSASSSSVTTGSTSSVI